MKKMTSAGRAPHGARGLKLHPTIHRVAVLESRPSRGAWIETFMLNGEGGAEAVAPLTGRVD